MMDVRYKCKKKQTKKQKRVREREKEIVGIYLFDICSDITGNISVCDFAAFHSECKHQLDVCLTGLTVSVVGLERSLHQYTLEPSEAPFDMKSVPLATQPIVEQKGYT